MAEKEGFEPPVPFLAQLISSQSHSATLPLLLRSEIEKRFKSAWQALTEICHMFCFATCLVVAAQQPISARGAFLSIKAVLFIRCGVDRNYESH